VKHAVLEQVALSDRQDGERTGERLAELLLIKPSLVLKLGIRGRVGERGWHVGFPTLFELRPNRGAHRRDSQPASQGARAAVGQEQGLRPGEQADPQLLRDLGREIELDALSCEEARQRLEERVFELIPRMRSVREACADKVQIRDRELVQRLYTAFASPGTRWPRKDGECCAIDRELGPGCLTSDDDLDERGRELARRMRVHLLCVEEGAAHRIHHTRGHNQNASMACEWAA
jgi:hypothetical protein